jgi:DNA-binding GntR family transcriptional regulator
MDTDETEIQKRRGRGIFVERRPQKDEAPSGAAYSEDVPKALFVFFN